MIYDFFWLSRYNTTHDCHGNRRIYSTRANFYFHSETKLMVTDKTYYYKVFIDLFSCEVYKKDYIIIHLFMLKFVCASVMVDWKKSTRNVSKPSCLVKKPGRSFTEKTLQFERGFR